ncbi:ubiquitin-like modifier-activating enzyme 5 [Bidens hawaiensis]|uniref:ubiquitin-like modifier-activating enzyme 5 n=1 Tax=Bidens hawaiensis TaxID=980011 RepID=UPI00404A0D1F
MAMKPNPQCSNGLYVQRQKEYMLIKPARDATLKAKMEEELSTIEIPVHADNEWNIRFSNSSLKLCLQDELMRIAGLLAWGKV